IGAEQKGHVFTYDFPIDRSQHLLEDISVGFAASTGEFTQLNQIKSWSFSTATTGGDDKRGHLKKKKVGLLLAILVLILAIAGSFLGFYVWRRVTRKGRLAYRNLEKMINA